MQLILSSQKESVLQSSMTTDAKRLERSKRKKRQDCKTGEVPNYHVEHGETTWE